MKDYPDETFIEKLRSINFFDYSNHKCVNNTYQDFVTKFFSVVNSVALIKTLKVKSNTKPCFNIEVQSRKLRKAILNMRTFKNFAFRKTLK